jgi:hypothetical protein
MKKVLLNGMKFKVTRLGVSGSNPRYLHDQPITLN